MLEILVDERCSEDMQMKSLPKQVYVILERPQSLLRDRSPVNTKFSMFYLVSAVGQVQLLFGIRTLLSRSGHTLKESGSSRSKSVLLEISIAFHAKTVGYCVFFSEGLMSPDGSVGR